jgi:RNA polymerase sigma-70 factor, ECF subfamily
MIIEKPDSFLLSELKSGNARAFEKIFKDHYAIMCRYANSLLRDHDKAQSLVQNAFLKLWESRMQLGDVRSILPYLTTMVKNEVINYLKREKRQVKLSKMPEDTHPDQSTENLISQNELQEHIIIALNALPERCRQAFEMSRFDNLPNREIAEVMKISVKGVEALITRSMKILRTKLAEFLPSGKDKILPGNLLFLLVRKINRLLSD